MLIFWSIFWIWVFWKRNHNINRSLHEYWQECKLIGYVGVLKPKVKETLANTNNVRVSVQYYFANGIKVAKSKKEYYHPETDPPMFVGLLRYWASDWINYVGYLLIAVQINKYADQMPPEALRLRDQLFSMWTERPDGWENYTLDLSPECIKEFAKEETLQPLITAVLELPPDIKADMEDRRKRSNIMRQFHID